MKQIVALALVAFPSPPAAKLRSPTRPRTFASRPGSRTWPTLARGLVMRRGMQ